MINTLVNVARRTEAEVLPVMIELVPNFENWDAYRSLNAEVIGMFETDSDVLKVALSDEYQAVLSRRMAQDVAFWDAVAKLPNRDEIIRRIFVLTLTIMIEEAPEDEKDSLMAVTSRHMIRAFEENTVSIPDPEEGETMVSAINRAMTQAVLSYI